MSKTCWYCEKENMDIADDFYGDFNCRFCGVENSCYDPKEYKPYEPNGSERKEEMRIKLGGFIKADVDVKQGDTIIILDEGIEQENENYTNEDGTPKIDHIFKIEVAGEERKLTMNRKSLSNFIEKYGNETTKWVGKIAVVNIFMTAQGKKGIILQPK